MARPSVKLDFSLIEPALRYIEGDKPSIERVLGCEAARGVYAHASRFGNTEDPPSGFWEKILEKAGKDKELAARTRASKAYLEEADLAEAGRELASHLPEEAPINYTLYGEVGYDIGVVSEGAAFLNLGHRQFADTRELVFFAVHELHHVGYTRIQPVYSFSEVKTTRDFERVIRYSTHLEGSAVYAAYGMRLREGKLGHVDYQLYADPPARERILAEHAAILSRVAAEPERPLKVEDWGLLSRLSGERLWYVVGLHMAKTIDEELGRRTLTNTVRGGPDSFFSLYSECKPRP